MDELARTADRPPPSGDDETAALAAIVRGRCVKEGSAVDVRNGLGRPVGWFIDMKAALLHPQFLRGAAAAFLRLYGTRDPLQIACYDGFGAALLGAILASYAQDRTVRGLVIRREQKPSGLGNLVEGEPDGTPCIVVDDIINSGQSAERIVSVLAEYGTPVEAVFAVLSHANPALTERAERLNIEVRTLFTAEQFGFRARPSPPEPRAAAWFTRWSRKTSRDIRNTAHPVQQIRVCADRVVHARRAGGVYCFSVEDGSLIWKQPGFVFEPASAGASPVVVDGRILVGGTADETVLLDIETGRPIWRARFGDLSCNTPLIDNAHGTAVQGLRSLSRDGARIVRYDLETGRLRDEHRVDFMPASDFQPLPGGRALVVSETGALIRLSPDLAVELRRETLPPEPHQLIASGQRDPSLLAIGQSGRVSTVEAASLATRTIGHATGSVTGARFLSGADLHIASSRNWIYRLSFEPGPPKIKRSTTLFMGRVVANTATVKGRLFAADTAGWLYELDEDLNTIAQTCLGHGIEQMEAAGEQLILLHQNGCLRCLCV